MGAPTIGRRHLNAVLSSPAAGKEREYGRWYDELHMADCLRGIVGYVSAQRFRIEREASVGTPPAWEYAALYELDADRLADVFVSVEEFKRARNYEPPRDRVAPGLSTWVYSAATSRADAGGPVFAGCRAPHRLCLCFSRAHHAWHDEHLRERVAPQLSGFSSATHYTRGAQRLGVSPPWELLTVYELDAEGIVELVRERATAALGDDTASWVLSPVSVLFRQEHVAGLDAA